MSERRPTPETPERALLTVAEAAAALNVSRATVWRWIDAGKLPAYRAGAKTIRIRREDLDGLLQPARAGHRVDEPGDIWAGYDADKVRTALRKGAGVLVGVDLEALRRDIREGRGQESQGRPA